MFLIFVFNFLLDDTLKLCLKDLSENVISELERRLESDEDAKKLVCQSFGINPSHLPPKFSSVFSLFPDTPVKLLKNVFEALQLYDLLELLEQQTKSFTARSLRLALTLDEIKKLRNTTDRPTTFHSCGAVLIFVDDEDESNVIGIKTFFTDLDTKSDVTIIHCRDWIEGRRETRALMRGRLASKEEMMAKIEEHETAIRKEEENIETATLTVIERWIERQGWCK